MLYSWSTARMKRRTADSRIGACLLAFAAGLSGCDSQFSGVRHAADSVRLATEHMASRDQAESAAREARIVADGEQIERQQARDDGTADQTPRYTLRRDSNGWTVYDTSTGRPAHNLGLPQTGLSRARAQRIADELESEGKGDTGGGLGESGPAQALASP